MAHPEDMTRAELVRELKDCRNELCHQCGGYLNAHLGRCDGCRWKLEPKENAAP